MSSSQNEPWPAIETPWDDHAVEMAAAEAIMNGRSKVRRSSMRLGEYNGFSTEVRLEADRRIKVAIELGLIPRPIKCGICGCEGGRIDYHAEDYRHPLRVAPICQRCHMALHNRNRSAGFARNWRRLVAAHGNGSKWFERLVLTEFETQVPQRTRAADVKRGPQ